MIIVFVEIRFVVKLKCGSFERLFVSTMERLYICKFIVTSWDIVVTEHIKMLFQFEKAAYNRE